ncbi:uncharacterized protein A4U43_C03F18790 [Asparagus officinalis]|uniref:Uncharacterized protein n=1 Tax=Asparagus officinalis TaxID=4686 RepID=A0A5P1FFI1_ASPOF|nr:uncharacterized protein A4U43_C03F18790 [Asparagus officinalis]
MIGIRGATGEGEGFGDESLVSASSTVPDGIGLGDDELIMASELELEAMGGVTGYSEKREIELRKICEDGGKGWEKVSYLNAQQLLISA